MPWETGGGLKLDGDSAFPLRLGALAGGLEPFGGLRAGSVRCIGGLDHSAVCAPPETLDLGFPLPPTPIPATCEDDASRWSVRTPAHCWRADLAYRRLVPAQPRVGRHTPQRAYHSRRIISDVALRFRSCPRRCQVSSNSRFDRSEGPSIDRPNAPPRRSRAGAVGLPISLGPRFRRVRSAMTPSGQERKRHGQQQAPRGRGSVGDRTRTAAWAVRQEDGRDGTS